MKTLPLKIRKNGFTYVQLLRGMKTFLYEQRGPEGRVIGYEVFKEKIRSKRFIKGNRLEASIRFPHNEAFGNWAWSFGVFSSKKRVLERAFNKYFEVLG